MPFECSVERERGGRRTTLTPCPNDLAGKFCLNFDLTIPEFPCERVTFPQMIRTLEPLMARCAV